MAKTASLNIRLDPEIKKTAETVYAHYGLSLAEAVTVFIHQSCNIGGLPFDLRPAKPVSEPTKVISETGQNSNDLHHSAKLPCSTALGLWKGKVWMSDDFNDPLEEMKEYM